MRKAITILLAVMLCLGLGACGETANDTEDNVSSTTSENTSANSVDTPSTWSEVITFEGDGIKNTESFEITANEWKIIWDTKPGTYGDMNFQIYVYTSDGALSDVAANVIGESQDETIIRGSGSYYLMINSGQPYTIKIEQKD